MMETLTQKVSEIKTSETKGEIKTTETTKGVLRKKEKTIRPSRENIPCESDGALSSAEILKVYDACVAKLEQLLVNLDMFNVRLESTGFTVKAVFEAKEGGFTFTVHDFEDEILDYDLETWVL
jgi:hypothetical protein